jgi:hypothetical protein
LTRQPSLVRIGSHKEAVMLVLVGAVLIGGYLAVIHFIIDPEAL